MSAPFTIVEAIYPGMTQLDFTAPHTVFSRLPGAEVIVASAEGGEVRTEGDLCFSGIRRLADIERCDLLFAPGGRNATIVMNDRAYMDEFERLAAGAKYLTSVCTGSLILAATGRLRGKRAACHWAWRDMLPLFGAIPDAGRVVRDGDIITGGGVTAGLDFALTVAAELAGAEFAQQVQLGLEYAPAPPFDAGRPETAPPQVVAAVRRAMEGTAAARRAEAERAAGRL
jgi:putative intracellular protease/amidase